MRACALVPLAVAVALVGACGGSGDRISPLSVVRVTVAGCGLAPQIATGFGVAGGLIVTAAHPLAGDGLVGVDGRTANVIALDPRTDLATLSLDGIGQELPPRRAPVTGEAVTVVRWRDGALVSDGAHVTAVTTIRFNDLVEGTTVERAGVILDIAVVGGDSGAPVVGGDGRVVAVVFAASKASDRESYAVSAAELDALTAGGRLPPVDRGDC